MRLVFAHGTGAVGADAFPQQAAGFPDAEFPVLPGYGDDEPAVGDVAVAAQSLALQSADAHGIVGYSYGGVVAAMAACMELPAALVLIEPALFQLARDRPATAALIERLEPIYLDPTLTDDAFGRSFLRELRGEDPGELATADALRWSRRTRLHGAPWRHPIDPECLAETPTLVLTGGWNAEYEEVAAALAALGAQHEVLAGHGHRVIDHPDASARIRSFVETA
ncbi:alpha/beta hydrolase [Agrococcus sp. ARC_14]|uniref:alpha/beta hydrolase n=1 Tax=Agrococcus sp. ARC_14 TaxID=2919927 RepID=UPI001F05F851|nr:alpha/beta hydrolase [Agrococcus sp. ARC_14]MCH1882794.1 alpha/beta hydrolase [Agrococcus sp. ARC_14]